MYAKYYTYKLPEDYTLKQETRLKLDALVNKTGLSNEDAQRFVDIHVELTEDYASVMEEAMKGAVIATVIVVSFFALVLGSIAVTVL